MLQQKSVLVVEDSDMIRNITCRMLKKMGCGSVVESENGRIALEKMSECDFDLIFSDIDMPEMNGLELVEKVREQKKSLPIVILSSHTEKDIQDRAFELGVNDYLTKPLSPAILSGAIAKVFPTVI